MTPPPPRRGSTCPRKRFRKFKFSVRVVCSRQHCPTLATSKSVAAVGLFAEPAGTRVLAESFSDGVDTVVCALWPTPAISRGPRPRDVSLTRQAYVCSITYGKPSGQQPCLRRSSPNAVSCSLSRRHRQDAIHSTDSARPRCAKNRNTPNYAPCHLMLVRMATAACAAYRGTRCCGWWLG